ncbi:LysR family transcriptional regulator [Mesorhizobium sp. Root102]|uniref:LysR family transcriptional regulator n=1 Tax=Mesorhizobium sp. Root102 TaxID=1736422 RepID=UPI0006FA92ED|nr:LysR family transcriptional regulator [Mesorhizobium sp. Root102]KQU89628.1 LysR family transcriptional regulator [Mesorhizobium sp. Root102]
MIDLRTLETFYVVAQTGGFHRAAEKLNTTQPAVSARIAQLEQQLKVRVLERDKRGSHLTVKGRELLGYVERIMALRTEMILAIAGRDGLGTTVQLGVSETIVHTWLPDLLKRLNKEYPSITLEVSVDGSANLTAALVEGSINVALLIGPVNVGNATNLPLCDYPISWIVPTQLPLKPDPVTLDDLAAFPIITFARRTRPYWQLLEILEKAHLHKVRIFANSSLSSIIRMTLDGIGVAAIPTHVVAEHLAAGQLRVVDTGHEMPVLTFTASFFKRADMPLNSIVAEIAQQVAMQHRG